MKHLKEYEDQEIESLMGDLEEIGHDQPMGFMWYGELRGRGNAGFLVTGANERECVNSVIENQKEIFLLSSPINDSSKYENFDDLLDEFSLRNIISEGTYFWGFKAKSARVLIKNWSSDYIISPKYMYDQAKEYFKNADEIFSDQGTPEDSLWTKK
jgi:hypothetical protein